jgi:hypothetical protein
MGDVEWVTSEIVAELSYSYTVNDGSDSCWQVASGDNLHLSDITQLIDWNITPFLVDNQGDLGIVTGYEEDWWNGGFDFDFVQEGSTNTAPRFNNDEASGILIIPPNSEGRLATGESLRKAFREFTGDEGSQCDPCRKGSEFVKKEELLAVFEKSLSREELFEIGLPEGLNRRGLLFEKEMRDAIQKVAQKCQRFPKCGDDEQEKADQLFSCIERDYWDIFPGPETTNVYDFGEGDILYYRAYYISGCGVCGHWSGETALASYQRHVYYAFDWEWEYLAPLDDALYMFCH